MYVQVVQPAPPAPNFWCRTLNLGCPRPLTLSPDALADVLTGVKPAGMAGCSGGCKCGGKCKGMGDAAPLAFYPGSAAPAAPGLLAQFTDPMGSDLSVLSQQLADLNAKTEAVNQNIASSNWGTWVLVGLGGVGAWYAWKNLRSAASAIRERGTKRRARTRTAKRKKLKAELAAL